MYIIVKGSVFVKNLKELNNMRQIPKTKEYCANKEYYDILYGYLQQQSQWEQKKNNNRRYVNKKLINFSQLGRQLGISRQTVSNKFKKLIKLGLVIDEPGDRYYLTPLSADIASLIPNPTLKLITDTLNEYSISVYVYLLMRYIANDEKEFLFKLSEVKKHIGICATTRSNDDIIVNILFVLQKIGLIKYHLTTFQQNNVEYRDVKTIYQLDYLTNYIEI